MRPTADAMSRAYLLALVTWTDHKQPVLPFRTDAYYTCIMSGKPWVRVPKGEFKLEAGDLDTVPKAQGQRNAKANVAAAKPLSPQEPGVQEEEEEDCGGEASVDVNAEPSEPSEPLPVASECESEVCGSASGSSSSNSRSSSSKSSGSSSSSEASAAALPALPAQPAAPASPASIGSGVGARGPGGGGLRGGALAEDTFYWREFKFTRTFKRDGAPKGLEVACPYHDKCRRNRAAAKFGGMDRLTLVLKTWCVCVAACDQGREGGEDHMGMPDEEPMPEDSLEAMELPQLDVQPAVKRRRRAKAPA